MILISRHSSLITEHYLISKVERNQRTIVQWCDWRRPESSRSDPSIGKERPTCNEVPSPRERNQGALHHQYRRWGSPSGEPFRPIGAFLDRKAKQLITSSNVSRPESDYQHRQLEWCVAVEPKGPQHHLAPFGAESQLPTPCGTSGCENEKRSHVRFMINWRPSVSH